MISINRLQEYLVESKDSIPEINSVGLVVDESQIVERMKSFKDGDNLLLLGVIPEFDSQRSRDVDSMAFQTYIAFLVLEKINYRNYTSINQIDVWERTQKAMIAFKNKLLNDSLGNGTCPEFQFLDVKSINIEPVWKMAECNGWILTATLN